MEQLKKKVVGIAALAFAAAFGAGVASANVQAKAETDWTQFAISETSVRLGAGTEEDPSGLRFKVDCPVDYSANAEVEAYTTISFTSSVLGSEASYSTNVPASVWRADGSGWNAVLLSIPASDYVTEITAKSYVVVDGQTYESNEVTTSIAKTSSQLLAQGATDEALATYTANAVSAISLGENDGVSVEAVTGDTVQLSATTSPAGYGVVWSSSDESVATVDNNGKVTVVRAGTANITASMGGASATCAVTASWGESFDFENGVNSFVGVDPNALWTNDGIVMHEGDNALKFTMNFFAGAFSLSHEYLHWAFYETGAEDLTFTVSADTDITEVARMHEATIAWYGSEGVFDAWQWSPCKYEIVDGNVNVTLTAANYKNTFAEDGTSLRNVAGAIEGTPYYFGIRVTLSDANGQLEEGAAVYLDDFKLNYPEKPTDLIDFENGRNSVIGIEPNAKATYDGVVSVNGNKVVQMTSGSAAWAFSLSKEYMTYAFYEKGAESVSFTLSAEDTAIVSAPKMKWAGIALYGASYDGWDKGNCSYEIVDGALRVTIPASGYTSLFDADGNFIGTLGGEGAGTTYHFGVRLQVADEYGILGAGTAFYLDDFQVNYPAKTFDTIDFEDGANIAVGVEANAKWTNDGIVTHEGDKALKFTMNSNAGGFSLSHEYMRWAFYEKGAESITFTVSADTDITEVTRMHESTIAWYGSQGSFDIWQWTPCATEIVDGNVKVTLTAEQYKATYAEDGTCLRNVGGAVEGTPYYFGLRVTLSDANGVLGAGTAIYLDDFQVNYAAA